MERVSEERNVSKRSFISCNIRSINKNIDNFASASAIKQAQVMCLQETWMDPLASQMNLLEYYGWQQHNNSVGKGKEQQHFTGKTLFG